MVIRSSHKGFGESSILSTATNRVVYDTTNKIGAPDTSGVGAPKFYHMNHKVDNIDFPIHVAIISMVGNDDHWN